MKRIKKLAASAAVIIFLFPIFCMKSYAKTQDELLADFSAVIPDKYTEIANPEEVGESISLSSILGLLGSELEDSGGRLSGIVLFTLGICALSLLAQTYKNKLSRSVRFGIMCVSMSALLLQVSGIISSAVSALNEATEFFSSVIPVFCAVNASGGGASTANVQAASMSFTVSLCTAVISNVMPFIAAVVYTLDMLGVLGADNKIAKSTKNLYAKILGAVTIIVGVIFSFQNIVSSAGDSVAIRTAKYGAANLIPVVGSTVSSSLGLLSGGLSYVKSVTGVGAMAVLIYILLSPLAMLLVFRLIFSICASIESGAGESVSVISPTLGIIDCIIASYSLCLILYIFEIILFMRYGLVL